MRRSPVVTVAIVAIVLISMIALPLGTGLAIADTTGDVSELNAVPISNIEVTHSGTVPSALGSVDEWGVSASRHSETLGVEVRLVDGELEELVLDDEINHAGREVAVDAQALAVALPDVSTVDDLPEKVYGEHETEGRWSRDLVVKNGMAIVEIPFFSTNTLRFSGEYRINSTVANDTRFSYNITGDDFVSETQVELVGVDNSLDQTEVFSGRDGDSVPITISGDETANVDLSISPEDGIALEEWSYSNGAKASSSAIDRGSNTSYAALGTSVVATDIDTGTVTWSTNLGEDISDISLSEDGTVLYASTKIPDGSIYALDTSDYGAELSQKSGLSVAYATVLDENNGTLYLGGSDGSITAIDSTNGILGNEKWSTDLSGYQIAGIDVSDDLNSVFATDSVGVVSSIDTETNPGYIRWDTKETSANYVSQSGDTSQTIDVSSYNSIEVNIAGSVGDPGNTNYGLTPRDPSDGGAGTVVLDVSGINNITLISSYDRMGYENGIVSDSGKSFNIKGGDGGGSSAITNDIGSVLVAAGGGGGSGGRYRGGSYGMPGGDGGGPGAGIGGDKESDAVINGSLVTSQYIVSESTNPDDTGYVNIDSVITKGRTSDVAYNDGTLYSIISSGDDSYLNKIDPDTNGGGYVITNTSLNGSATSLTINNKTGSPVVGMDNGDIKQIDTLGGDSWTYKSGSTTPASAISVSESGKTLVVASGTEFKGAYINPPVSDVSVTIDGETVSYSGSIYPGESVNRSVSLPPGSHTADISVGVGSAGFVAEWTETKHTEDPSVTIRSETGSETLDHFGTLSDGETVTFTDKIDTSILSGNVEVIVNTAKVDGGPETLTKMRYSHTANRDILIGYDGTSFREEYNVTRVYDAPQSEATLSIPFASDHVVAIEDVTMSKTTPEGSRLTKDPVYSWDKSQGELVVEIGDVEEGDSVEVSATGSKVRVESGSISIVKPSSPNQALDTRIRVDDVDNNGDVGIETTNLRQTAGVGRLAYISSTSWTDGVDQSLTHLDDGKHTVRLNDPILGGTATLSTGRLGADALSGDAYIKVIDMAEPRFRIEPGEETGGVVEVVDYDSLDGATYDLYRVSDGVVADTSVAGSSLSFRTGDKEGVYTIRTSDSSGAFAIAATASGSASSSWSGIPDWLLLLLGVSASIALLILSSSRVRPGSFGRLLSGSTVALGVGTVAILFVAVELLTDYSLVGSVTERGLRILGESTRSVTGSLSAVFIDPLTGTFGALVATIGLVLGVIALEQRTRLSVPLPVTIGVSGLAVVWLFESIAPGSVLGPLTSGLSEVGAAVWILGILSAVGVIYLWLRSRRPEIVIGGSS